MAKLISKADDARVIKKNAITKRKPDFTEGEAMFLRALLIDDPVESKDESGRSGRSEKVLDDEILFSLPFAQEEEHTEEEEAPTQPEKRRPRSLLLGLWHAYEQGVKPRALMKKGSSLKTGHNESEVDNDNDDESAESIKSDVEVRGNPPADDQSSCSSWKEEEGGQEHYDSWEVLKDEYAEDFGFGYTEVSGSAEEASDDDQGHVFKILGTSAADVLSHPHVLSPPLMDALMSFLPEPLVNQNFWLKYSLVRDGASMQTLKNYVRASHNNILAIETTTGEVFGAFTTSPWRTQFGFFGIGDGAFLWRMRHNRNTPCHSLFEQAQMETEIDVFAYSGLNNLVQHCSHDKLGIGGGDINNPNAESDEDDEIPHPVDMVHGESYGFGIALSEDLTQGTSSPCATFRNPCLLNNSSQKQTFAIANMEVWTLTPAWDVNSAEKLEMTKYFVDLSTHSVDTSSHSTYSDYAHSPPNAPPAQMAAKDLVQRRFYRRVGENDESETQRNRWQYANMMNLS